MVKDEDVKMIGVEAGGYGIDTDKHAATLTLGRPGVLHGSYSYLIQDDEGQVKFALPVPCSWPLAALWIKAALPTQVIDPHSISAGLDYPGIGPEHSFLKDIGRCEYVPATDDEALEAFQRLSKLEGIIPALETSHAIAHLDKLCPNVPAGTRIVINCSGRGDKDVNNAAKYINLA